MIFNKNDNGSRELRELTGNYYANNDFNKIITDIELATEEISALIGVELYKKVEGWYKETKDDGIQGKRQAELHYRCCREYRSFGRDLQADPGKDRH